jgi:hypothetical protein
MEVILERLLLDLAVFAVQLAIRRLLSWLHQRTPTPAAPPNLSVAA